MGQISIAAVYWSVIIKNINNVLSWSLMVCWHQDEGNTFFINIILLIQLPKGVNKKIDPFVSEFIPPTVNNQYEIFGKSISKHRLCNIFQFSPGSISDLFKFVVTGDKRIFESIWSDEINFLSKKMAALFRCYFANSSKNICFRSCCLFQRLFSHNIELTRNLYWIIFFHLTIERPVIAGNAPSKNRGMCCE